MVLLHAKSKPNCHSYIIKKVVRIYRYYLNVRNYRDLNSSRRMMSSITAGIAKNPTAVPDLHAWKIKLELIGN